VRQAFPDAKLTSICHWGNINRGIIENDLHVHKITRATDALVTEAITHYFKRGNAPKLLFVQLDNVDHAAHTYGGYSDEYYKAVADMDVYLGEIYDAIEAKGLMKNSLFIVVADHGENENGHGGQSKDESSAVVAVAGHSVNCAILNEGVHNRDVSAIALYALGVERPTDEAFIAQVPAELFGESREKTVDPNPMSAKDRAWRTFLYFFIGIANRIASPFDKR
jgi:phosphopentomutase